MKEKGDEFLTFDEFSLPLYKDWLHMVEKSLKNKKVQVSATTLYEEIALKPIYRTQDMENVPHLNSRPGFPPYVRGNESLGYRSHPWEVSQELSGSSLEEVAVLVKEALERGQTTLHFRLCSASRRGEIQQQVGGVEERLGLSISCLGDLEQVLSQVKWEGVPLFIEAGVVSFPFTCFLSALAEKNGMKLSSIQGCIGADPYAEWVLQGSLPLSLHSAFEAMVGTIRWTQSQMPSLQSITIQSDPYHNGGASAFQELAFTLATAVDYIRELQDRELSIDEAAGQMRFVFSAGTSFFTEIAKFRAARLLWSKIIRAFGGSEESQKMYIHARTSSRTKTLFDPYVNILRGTTEAFAAIIGGVNSLHVSPFDEPTGGGGELSQRIARNTQLILDGETHLSKVADPAGGSWYIESLTHSIAEKAWKLFQEVERMGGMKKALLAGFPQQEIERVAKKRKENVDCRIDRWVGTNMYPNPQEPSPMPRKKDTTMNRPTTSSTYSSKTNRHKLKKQMKINLKSSDMMNHMINYVLKGLTLPECYEIVRDSVQEGRILPIKPKRTTTSFEGIRMASISYREQTGSFPKVLIVNLGSPAGYRGKLDFLRDFFATGGFDVIPSDGVASIQDAVDFILDCGEELVVISGSSNLDPQWVQNLAKDVKKSKENIYLMLAEDPPPELLEGYTLAGISEFIHSRCNGYELLLSLQRRKGMNG